MKKLLRSFIAYSPDEPPSGGEGEPEGGGLALAPDDDYDETELEGEADADGGQEPEGTAAPEAEPEAEPASNAAPAPDPLDLVAQQLGISKEEAAKRLAGQAPPAEPEKPAKRESPREQALREAKAEGIDEDDFNWVDNRVSQILEERNEERYFASETMSAIPQYRQELEALDLPGGAAEPFARVLIAFGPRLAEDIGQRQMALDLALGKYFRTEISAGRNPLAGIKKFAAAGSEPANEAEPEGEPTPGSAKKAAKTPTGGGGAGDPLAKYNRASREFLARWQKEQNDGKAPTKEQLAQFEKDDIIS